MGPVKHLVHIGVNTRKTWSGTTYTPADYSNQHPAVSQMHQWTTAITLASIHSSSHNTSADHPGSDG